MRLLLTIPFLLSCSNLELHYPESKPVVKPVIINISSECHLKPSSGVIYYMVSETKELPSIACNKPAWGCMTQEGNTKYIYTIPNIQIAVEEYLHALGCLEHVD